MRLWVPAVARVRRGRGASPPPPNGGEPTWAEPITISAGGVYEGAWDSPDTTPAVTITTSEAVTVRGHARGYGHLVSAVGATKQNITLEDMTLTSLGYGRALQGDMLNSLVIQRCDLVNTRGVYLHESSNGSVSITNNRVRDIGRFGSNENPYNQFVQFDKSQDMSGSIAWNEVINAPGASRAEDVINFFDSGGTTSAQYIIERNFVRGAYPENALTDAFSGGGILVGDYGHGYTTVRDNVVIDTLNYGVAIAGGRGNRLNDNLVLGLNQVDGQYAAGANIGAYIWHQVGAGENAGDNGGDGNSIAWFNSDGNRNDAWMPDADFWTNTTALSDPTAQALTDAHDDWLAAARAQGWPW